MIEQIDVFRQRYLAALRDGDDVTARIVVDQARDAGIGPDAIYLQIFAPSMVRIGELWEQNQISVAEEHLATATTERLIGMLSPSFSQPAATGACGSVILGCIEGERHALGPRMLADLFRKHGWRVLYLGADVPIGDWVMLAVRHNVDAVGISAGTQRHMPAMRNLITELRSAQPDLLILVGGAVFNGDQNLWREVGADFFDPDSVAAVAHLTAHQSRRAAQVARSDRLERP